MIIHYKGIEENRYDAPFLGTLIIAPACTRGCRGCCNEYLKSQPVQTIDSEELLDKIKSDPFCEGIILAGLDPLTYPEEAYCLIEGAFARNLQVILYTSHTEEEVKELYPQLLTYKGLYIKVGEYDDTKISHTYSSFGIPLISTNQYIIKI